MAFYSGLKLLANLMLITQTKNSKMKIPTIKGVIDRRVLINYMVDPEIIAKLIPKPFRPQVYKGKAIVGICLIRLKDIRPKGLPAFMGLS